MEEEKNIMAENKKVPEENLPLGEREFWFMVRQALLLFVDAIEQRWCMVRTSHLRREKKEGCIDNKS